MKLSLRNHISHTRGVFIAHVAFSSESIPIQPQNVRNYLAERIDCMVQESTTTNNKQKGCENLPISTLFGEHKEFIVRYKQVPQVMLHPAQSHQKMEGQLAHSLP